MLEVGKKYKLKIIKGVDNKDHNYKIISIFGDFVSCYDEQEEKQFIFPIWSLIDPERPNDIYAPFYLEGET